jgi:hypothetical protein
MSVIIGLIILAGLASGVAIFISLVRRRPKPAHDSSKCKQCLSGFLCPEALRP